MPGLSDATLAYTVSQPAGVPGQPFALTVTRRSNQQALFDTTGHRYAHCSWNHVCRGVPLCRLGAECSFGCYSSSCRATNNTSSSSTAAAAATAGRGDLEVLVSSCEIKETEALRQHKQSGKRS
jgi:hypothetical protein